MKANRIAGIILLLILVVTCIGGCGSSNQKSIVGRWYNKNGKCLDIRSDGTWKLDGSYGTGTYKLLDDKTTFEFTDCYGDTQESEIIEDKLGKYIDFGYYGHFYKESYPLDDKKAEEYSESTVSSVDKTVDDEDDNTVLLDPFAGIKYEVSGISPYCKISINNRECTDSVQKYVTYQLDNENYANGETATITAVLSQDTDGETFALTSLESQYRVADQPEYISSVEGIDFGGLKAELNDYVRANIAEAIKQGTEGRMRSSVLGIGIESELKQIENLTVNDVYLRSRKLYKQGDSSDYFNYLTFIYSGSYIGKYDSGNFYSCVSAVNVIKYPDGTVKWGSKSPDGFDFVSEGSTEGMEYTVSAYIIAHSSDYNIEKVEIR